MSDNKIYPEDFKCIVCSKEAETFWPIIDGETANPYCISCLRELQIKLLDEIIK